MHASDDVQVRAGAAVTLTAQGADRDGDALTYAWSQQQGPTVALQTDGPRATFTAPDGADGTSLRFTVMAIDPGGLWAMDAVSVTLSASAPETAGQAGSSSAPVILSGSLPANGGFEFLMFGGGTSDQLVAAAGYPALAVRFWAIDAEAFVPYVPKAPTFVNAQWNALFANGLPARTIAVGACG